MPCVNAPIMLLVNYLQNISNNTLSLLNNDTLVLVNSNRMFYTIWKSWRWVTDSGTPPPLSQAFLAYIRELDADDSRDKYYEFFENYGTHFVKTIDYGARFTRTHQMTQSTYQHMSSSGFSVEAAASYEGLFSVSGSLSLTDSQREAVNEFRQGVTTKVCTRIETNLWGSMILIQIWTFFRKKYLLVCTFWTIISSFEIHVQKT